MEIGVPRKSLGELERLLGLFEAGKSSGALTVARLLLVSRDVASIERWLLERVPSNGVRHELLKLIEQHRHGCQCVAALRQGHVAEVGREGMLGAAPEAHGSDGTDRDRSGLAERIARDQVEREIVDRFQAWGLLGAERRTLELGCGVGRMQAALSSRVGLAAGVDSSAEMIARARWCCSRLRNARHEVADGSDLSRFDAASFELVYTVAPRTPAASERDAHVTNAFSEVTRVLAPAGTFVIVDLACREDSADAPDVAERARDHGLEAVGEQPFRARDGVTYRLLRRC